MQIPAIRQVDMSRKWRNRATQGGHLVGKQLQLNSRLATVAKFANGTSSILVESIFHLKNQFVKHFVRNFEVAGK